AIVLVGEASSAKNRNLEDFEIPRRYGRPRAAAMPGTFFEWATDDLERQPEPALEGNAARRAGLYDARERLKPVHSLTDGLIHRGRRRESRPGERHLHRQHV